MTAVNPRLRNWTWCWYASAVFIGVTGERPGLGSAAASLAAWRSRSACS